MKKLFLSLAVVGMMAVVTTSCTKECTCTTYMDGVKQTSATGEAKKCADLNEEYDQGGVTYKIECE